MVRPLSMLLFYLLACTLCAQDVHVHVDPHVTSGIEGTTEFPTIQNALDHHPFAGPGGRVVIEIAPGVYHERIIVTQNHANVTLLGTGARPEDTVISNGLNAKTAGGTFFTETAEINGAGFEADNLTIENTAGNTGQAVAAAVRADRVVFRHVRLLGHQDTLFADYGRQLYLQCYIEGGVDYIFGNATAVFEDSELHSNGPGFVTAQSRTDAQQSTGFVIYRSRVTADSSATGAAEGATAKHVGVGLGRPWRPFARVVYLNSSLPAGLDAGGWNNWGKTANESTAYFAEYASSGPGAAGQRVPWAHTLSAAEAARFLPQTFLRGADGWDAEAAAAHLP